MALSFDDFLFPELKRMSRPDEVLNVDSIAREYFRQYLEDLSDAFVWKNLPETFDAGLLEPELGVNGILAVFRNTSVQDWPLPGNSVQVEAGLYYLPTAPSNTFYSVYHRPTQVLLYSPALPKTTTANPYTVGKDVELLYNDVWGTGYSAILEKWAYMKADAYITLRTMLQTSRLPVILSGSKDQKEDLGKVWQAVLSGDVRGFLVTNDEFSSMMASGVPAIQHGSPVANLNDVIAAFQFADSKCWSDFGLNANYNMKREALNSSETNAGGKTLLPYIDMMLQARKRSVEKVNAHFGTNLSVELNEAWVLTKEEQTASALGEFEPSMVVKTPRGKEVGVYGKSSSADDGPGPADE